MLEEMLNLGESIFCVELSKINAENIRFFHFENKF